MRNVFCLLAVALFGAVTAVAFPAAARGADAVAMVSGGGTADFVATPNSVNNSGYTNFSVGVTAYSDGSAQGHFVCQIPGIVTISGDVLSAWVNDDDSVTVIGLGRGYDHFFATAFADLPFTATFRNGGAGAGGFDYRDESGFFGAGQYDTEVVRRGMIGIAIAE